MFRIDSNAENLLTQRGVRHKYRNDIAFDMLDPKWRDTNLGRSRAQVAEAVAEYKAWMDGGSEAPAPILWVNAHGKLEVLDGTQRLLAAEQKRPAVFNAYVVECDSATALRLRIFANYKLHGGHQESDEWTLERAIKLLVLPNHMTCEDCADFGGWTVARVREKQRIIQCRDQINAAGGPERLSDAVTSLFVQHADPSDYVANAPALATFANTLQRTRMTADDAEPHIERFFDINRNKGRVFQQFDQKLQEFLEDEDVQALITNPRRRQRQKQRADILVMATLKRALTVTERARDDGETLPNLPQYQQVCNQIKKTLDQIGNLSRNRRGNGRG